MSNYTLIVATPQWLLKGLKVIIPRLIYGLFISKHGFHIDLRHSSETFPGVG